MSPPSVPRNSRGSRRDWTTTPASASPEPATVTGARPSSRAHEKLLGCVGPAENLEPVAFGVRAASKRSSGSLTGIQTRDWMGVKASQKLVTISGVTLLWTKDDGAITDLHLYFDVAAVKAQLGPGTEAPVSAAAQAAGSSAFDATLASGSPEVFEQESSPRRTLQRRNRQGLARRPREKRPCRLRGGHGERRRDSKTRTCATRTRYGKHNLLFS